MKEDMHLNMKVGIVHHTAFPSAGSKAGGTLASIMEIVRDPFFDAIEITSIQDPGERSEVKQALLSGGMRVCFHAMPKRAALPLNLAHPIESDRRSALQLLKEAMDEAYEMNAKLLTISHEFIAGAGKDEQTVSALNESLKEIRRYAASQGTMKVAYEPPFSATGVLNSGMIRSLIGSHPNDDPVGFLIDLEHWPVSYKINDKAVKLIKKHLTYFRTGNCCMPERYRQYNHQLGAGSRHSAVNADQLAYFLRELYQIGYIGEGRRGLLSLHVNPMDYESPQAVIANGKRTLLEAWRTLHLNQTMWPNC